MSEPDALKAIRTLIREQVERTSLRAVAKEIGCSPQTVSELIRSGRPPYVRLRRQLDGWYARQTGGVPPAQNTLLDAMRLAVAEAGRTLIPSRIMTFAEMPYEAEPGEEQRAAEAALLRSFLTGTSTERAESFITIYDRFYGLVRAEMESAGLSRQDAEQRVGAVFERTLAALRSAGTAKGEPGLREHLLDAARSMAEDPEWRQNP